MVGTNLMYSFFVFVFVLQDRVSLCSFGAYLGTHSIDQAGLEFSAFRVPGLKECVTTTWLLYSFKKGNLNTQTCRRFSSKEHRSRVNTVRALRPSGSAGVKAEL